MKGMIMILLVLLSFGAEAQNKHNLYADAAVSCLGFSATYDRRLSGRFDIGVGMNARYFGNEQYANSRSAVYLDLRAYRKRRRALWFMFADVGGGFNGGPEPKYGTISRMGIHSAVGGGYCYQLKHKAIGPYIAFGLYGYTSTVDYHDPPPPTKPWTSSYFDGYSVLSVGFKF